MSNFNKIVIVGRVATEIELRYITDGSPLAKFCVAVDRPKRPDGAQKTDFLNIVAWNKLAEICAEYLKKGRLVLIEGRIQVRSYETDEGKRKYVTEIIGSSMRMLEGISSRTTSEPMADVQPWSPSQESNNMQREAIPAPINNPAANLQNETVLKENPVSVPGEGPQPPANNSETFYTEDDIPF